MSFTDLKITSVCRVKCFAVLIALLFSVNRNASASGKTPNDTIMYGEIESLPPKKTTEISVMLGVADYQYKEPGLMSIEGNFTGAEISVRKSFEDSGFFSRLDSHYYSGEPEYVGRYNDGTPLKADSRDYFYALSLLAGPRFQFNTPTPVAVEIYGGVAHRYLNNDVRGRGSYERERTYNYLPIGVAVEIGNLNVGRTTIGVQWNQLIEGKNNSHLEDVNSGLPTLKFEQEDGAGSELFGSHALDIRGVNVVAKIFQRRWSIEKSYSVAFKDSNGNRFTAVEPKNSTTQNGLSVGVVF